jgi:peroxiredoxin
MKRIFIFILIPFIWVACTQNQNNQEKQGNNEDKKSQKEVEADIKASTRISEGQKVPEFTFTTTRGKELSTESLRGKVVLYNFFATWCPSCMKEMPALQDQVWQKYGNNEDFFMVSIGREQNMKKMETFKKEKGYDFHFAPDTGRVIYGKFAEKYIPRNVVVNKEGTIVYQNTGYTEEEFQNMMAVIEEEMGD